jgi:hypothetical protein
MERTYEIKEVIDFFRRTEKTYIRVIGDENGKHKQIASDCFEIAAFALENVMENGITQVRVTDK